MAIFNDKQYMNRYDAAQMAVENGNWRDAYDYFMDCKGYIERTQPWNDTLIEHLKKMSEICNNNFK